VAAYTTGRYQSRLFNFIADRSIQFGDAAAKAFRHAKFAAQTAAQAILYPIYAIFQTARRVDRQVRSAAAKAKGSLPESDASIRTVLEEIDRLDVTENSVCGIACSCESQNLVLVGTQNQIFDVLPPAKQTHLNRTILAEVEDHFSPVYRNGFDRLMGWVQNSGIAKKLNFFNEASLPPVSSPSPSQNSSIVSSEQLHEIDRRVATLETEYFIPIAESPETVFEKLHHIIKAAIDYFFGLDEDYTVPQSYRFTSTEANAWVSGSPEAASLPETGSIEPCNAQIKPPKSTVYERVKALIEAAIVYFFGFDDPFNVPPQSSSPQFDTTTVDRVSNPQIFDPKTLPVAELKEADGDSSQNTTSALPQGETVSNPFLKLTRPLKRWVASGSIVRSSPAPSELKEADGDSSQNTTSALSQAETVTPPIENVIQNLTAGVAGSSIVCPSQPKSEKPAVGETEVSAKPTVRSNVKTQDVTSIDPLETATVAVTNQQTQQQSSAPEFNPDWFDARVMDSGYVKHPLEVVLEWLDRVMLKVELWIGQFWNWLSERWFKPSK